MRDSIYRIVKGVLLIVSCFFVFSGIPVFAEDPKSSNSDNVEENEVVIHSPDLNTQPLKSVDEDLNIDEIEADELINLSDEKIDELFKFLEKEQSYLKKLDAKYDSLSGDAKEGNEEGGVAEDASDGDDVYLEDDLTNEFKNKFDNEVSEKKEQPKKPLKKVKTEQKDKKEPLLSDEEKKKNKKDAINRKMQESEDKKGSNKSTKKGNKKERQKDEEKEGSAENKLEEVIYKSPFEAAEIYYELGKYKKALDEYEIMGADYPNESDYIWSRFQIANCYRNLKKLESAIERYQEFINKYPDSFWSEQAFWYMEDAKWWQQWNNRVGDGK